MTPRQQERQARIKKLHTDVWHAAIRFYVYRTPKRNAKAVKHLQAELRRYARAIRRTTREGRTR